MARALLLALTICIHNVSAFGTPEDSLVLKPALPYYGGVHFAGNAGLFSVNFGTKFFKQRLLLGAGYGYLPEAVNGVEVHSIYLKTSYCFRKGFFYSKAKWYAGFTTIYGFTNNTFIKLPSHYPKEYYAPNAVHFAPYLGLRLPFLTYKPTWASKVNLHVELGTLDAYVWYSITNKSLKFWDICNLSAGIYYDL